MRSSIALSDRRGLWAFVLRVIAVTGGVFHHQPMFVMGRMTHFKLYCRLLLVSWFGKETRGRDLRDLDPDGHTFAATGV
jgi:hypothetical protein